MIPYIEFHELAIGPLRLHAWGFFVAVGILLAAQVSRREARARGLHDDTLVDMITWIVIAGLVGGRLLHAFGYEAEVYRADPLRILRVWEGGLSSFGAFIGGAVGGFLFSRIRKVRLAPYMEALCFALPLGYGCGRIGCFLIHDHPGTLSQSPLAVAYPGGSRFDLGLASSVLGFALFAGFLALRRWAPGLLRRTGYAPLLMLSYGCVRFLLDFLRATDLPHADVRYAGLTPAQYACIGLVAAGTWLLIHRFRNDYGKAASTVPA